MDPVRVQTDQARATLVTWLALVAMTARCGLVVADTFNVHFLPGSYSRVSDTRYAAAAIGMEQYIQDHPNSTLFAEHEVRVHYQEGLGCRSESQTSAVVTRLALDGDLDAVLGSICSWVCIPVSWSLARWNIAQFPDACSDDDISDKVKYPNIIRVHAPLGKLRRGVLEVMKYFGWRRAALWMTRRRWVCSEGGNAIEDIFSHSDDVTLTEWIRHNYNGNMPVSEIDFVLRRIRQRARVIWLCARDKDVVNIMLHAQKLGMTNGDFVFFFYARNPLDEGVNRRVWEQYIPDDLSDREWETRRQAFYPLKMFSAYVNMGPANAAFRSEVALRNSRDYGMNYSLDTSGVSDFFAPYLHDAMYLYLLLLEEILEDGGNPRDGRLFFERSKWKTFQGIAGRMAMDSNGDPEPGFALWFNGPNTEELVHWLSFQVDPRTDTGVWVHQGGPEVFWGTPDNSPPPDEPRCGFKDERCPPDTTGRDLLLGGFGSGVLCVFIVIAIIMNIKRRRNLERELAQMLWRIIYEDIEHLSGRATSVVGMSMRSMRSGASGGSGADRHAEAPVTCQLGLYKGAKVAIRHIHCGPVTLTRENLLELKTIRDMSHDNINGFVGICIESPNVCIVIVTQYCPKGSLQDILENDEIKLDWMFKLSLITDIANGMAYINQSSLGSHGHLRSSCCVVDSRWQIKLTSLGLHFLRTQDSALQDIGEYQKYRKLLWTAPELLRMPEYHRPLCGTKSGDVYSFAILLQEILYRAMPYFVETLTPKEVVALVVAVQDPPYRPVIPKSAEPVDQGMLDLMRQCWQEQPGDRPDVAAIKHKLKDINKGRKINIVDNMIQKMEVYATNLEEIVQSRTAELTEEKKKTDALLYRMLPSTVAEKLKVGETVRPEMFDDVTIYFSDIVGFTEISSASTPVQVVALLNDLYTLFDDVIDQHDVYKVETIGDSYMVASGLPRRNGDRHVGEIANLALDLLSTCHTEFKIRHRPEEPLLLRIGIHTGPCAAGVVGLTMPRFCLFGDTVNMASRMETNGQALRIHMSMFAQAALEKLGGYHIQLRGEMPIKGKGIQKTFWLVGRDGLDKRLPPMDP